MDGIRVAERVHCALFVRPDRSLNKPPKHRNHTAYFSENKAKLNDAALRCAALDAPRTMDAEDFVDC